MSRFEPLRRVADLVGIATRHVDALGIEHEVDEETLARLIAAFGLSAEPAEAAATLAEEEHTAIFGLRPIHIAAQEDRSPVVHLRLPPGIDKVEWHIRLEDGVEHAGRADGSELHLPGGLPLGYHRLGIEAGGASIEIDLVVAPATAYLPDGLQPGARGWGLTTQLYGLRSARDWGIGDFADLAVLCRDAAALGAATVGINPLHALFAAEPGHFSPYSPSSRLWLNYVYIDVTAAPGFSETDAAPAKALAAVQGSELVDYPGVAAVKRPALEASFARFRRGTLAEGGTLADEFRAFQRAGGKGLAAFATFEALHEHFTANGGRFSWLAWPEAMRDPHSASVAEFAREHHERVEFFQFLQWVADRQLGAARGGLAIGLYRDLAVGANPHGAEAWADPELVAPGAAIGAPPDLLNRAGQNWGLAPINPLALRRRGFAPLIAALRANMRYAGILRIDHVMSLRRLYWVPGGSPATAGAYVNYPFQDMLRLVALESRRQRCAIVGEDLGTVPEGFREAMQAAQVLSYRVVMFERRWDANFKAPGEYPPLAAASAATHDLATLRGFWLGRDIAWRRRLDIYPDAAAEAAEQAERYRDRYQLIEALEREGLIPRERFEEFLPHAAEPNYTPELGEAILVYLARSRARLMLVQLEDIVGEVEQANLPGTIDAHPNWRRRLSVRLEELLAGEEIARVARLVNAARAAAAPE